MRTLLCAFPFFAICTVYAGPSVTQVSEGVASYFCNNGVGYQNIPGLSTSIHANGGAVVVTIASHASVTDGSIADLRPVVDGQALDDFFSEENNGANLGREITLHFDRAYFISSGIHTITAQINCPGSGEVNLARRWMTIMQMN